MHNQSILTAAGAGAITTLVLVTVHAYCAYTTHKRADGADEQPALVQGKPGTVLFVTSDAASSINVHLATLLSLLKDHQLRMGLEDCKQPPLEIHYVSNPAMEDKVRRVVEAAQAGAGGKLEAERRGLPAQVHFHACASLTQKTTADIKFTPIPVVAPGLPSVHMFARAAPRSASLFRRWTDAAFDEAYTDVATFIEQVDPAVVVTARDSAMLPVKAAVKDSGRRWVMLFPNALFDSFVWAQPRFKAGWKFPAVASGHPFPLPGRLIPLNMYLTLRYLLGFRHMQRDAALERSFVARYGIRDIHLPPHGRPNLYHLSASAPGVQIPMDNLPPHVHVVGPAVLSVAPVQQQDPALHAWLSAPGTRTVLINLGSLVRYSPAQVSAMAEAIAEVLSAMPDVQFLWKLSREGRGVGGEALSGDGVAPVVPEVLAEHVVSCGADKKIGGGSSGRVRVETWLKVDPPALLRSGHVALSVHHAGAGSYDEAVAAGVPHVVLPLWFDCYNYAALVEDFGLGIWACKETAPDWTAQGIAGAMLEVLGKESGADFRIRAREVGVKAPDGAARAAGFIADLATQ